MQAIHKLDYSNQLEEQYKLHHPEARKVIAQFVGNEVETYLARDITTANIYANILDKEANILTITIEVL